MARGRRAKSTTRAVRLGRSSSGAAPAFTKRYGANSGLPGLPAHRDNGSYSQRFQTAQRQEAKIASGPGSALLGDPRRRDPQNEAYFHRLDNKYLILTILSTING